MDSDLTNDFCRTHWSRLYSIARQRGCDPHSAEDAVQEVFLSLVRRQKMAELVLAPLAQQQMHLTVSLRCRISNAIRDQHRLKRGGSAVFVSLDEFEIADERTPSAALPDLRKALEALRKEMKPDAWSKLLPALLGDAPCRQQTGAYRAALCRARRRLRQLVNEAAAFPCRAGR
ncbi:RNA polymerase sigma factor [Prosthecobacter sp.]|uniref:RNA polymerase sigma factor n=1 Tax=Prosthecobacter sp. TaxID=1965333 RepID=UPI003784CC28